MSSVPSNSFLAIVFPQFGQLSSSHHVRIFVSAPAGLFSAAARCLFLGNVNVVHLSRVTAVSGVREEEALHM